MPAFISFNHIQRTWFVSSLRCTNNEFKVNSHEIISASDCHLDLHTLGCKNMQERESWYQCRELIIWQVHSDSTTLTETMDLHCTYQLCSLGCRHICHSYLETSFACSFCPSIPRPRWICGLSAVYSYHIPFADTWGSVIGESSYTGTS